MHGKWVKSGVEVAKFRIFWFRVLDVWIYVHNLNDCTWCCYSHWAKLGREFLGVENLVPVGSYGNEVARARNYGDRGSFSSPEFCQTQSFFRSEIFQVRIFIRPRYFSVPESSQARRFVGPEIRQARIFVRPGDLSRQEICHGRRFLRAGDLSGRERVTR